MAYLLPYLAEFFKSVGKYAAAGGRWDCGAGGEAGKGYLCKTDPPEAYEDKGQAGGKGIVGDAKKGGL